MYREIKEIISSWPKEVLQIAGQLTQRELSQMMIDYDVGVSATNKYEVKKIDHDYFGDE